MRTLFRKVIPVVNRSFLRSNAVRYCSNDSKNKETPIPPNEKKIVPYNQHITVEKYSGVMILNIERQDTRNSLDIETLKEITDAINHFDEDKDSLVLVINGEGGNFSSGFDIDEIDEKGYNAMKDASHRLVRRPFCEKPTIAAISGFAVAEGFELAMACDLRVIEESARLGCLGRRFGIPQTIYGERRLTALIGLSRALDLLMTGRLISGKEAHQMGLASKLTATGTALGEAVKLAKSMVKFPQAALIIDKMMAYQSVLRENTEDSMRDEAIMQSLLGTAIDDLKDGVKKFQQGIGKHGKFYQLKEVEVKEWELEWSLEEIEYIKGKEAKGVKKTDKKSGKEEK